MRAGYMIRLLAGTILVCTVLSAHAYDPMRAMRNGQISSGLGYSTFDPISSHGMVASPDAVVDEADELGVSLFNMNSFYQVQDVRKLTDELKVLVEDAQKIRTDLEKALTFRKDTENLIAALASRGTLAVGMASMSTLPTISWKSELLQGSLYFDTQRNISFGIDEVSQVPLGFDAKVTGGRVGLNGSCAKDADGDGFADDQNGDGIPDSLDTDNNGKIDRIGDIIDPRVLADFDANKCKLKTGASLDIRAVNKFSSYSVGYSRKVYEHTDASSSIKSGELVAGIRANYFSLTTSLYRLRVADDNYQNVRYADIVNETVDADSKDNSGIDFDLGLNWISDTYTAGITVGNILTPPIKYRGHKSVDPGMPIAIHGSWFFVPGSKRWGLRLHNDLTGQKDPLDNKKQWRSWSVGYASQSWFIPGFAIGTRHNIARNGLNYTTFGLKLFQVIRVQTAWSQEKVGNIPRSMMVSVSSGFSF